MSRQFRLHITIKGISSFIRNSIRKHRGLHIFQRHDPQSLRDLLERRLLRIDIFHILLSLFHYQPFIVLQISLNVNFELDDVVEHSFYLGMELFAECSRAYLKLFIPANVSKTTKTLT